MPLHDFWCQVCGVLQPDVYRSVEEGALSRPPICCGQPTSWIPQTTAMDVGGVKGAGFKSFTTYDGQNRKVTVNNLRDLRRLESESEKQARDGVGQPLRFRRWSQGDSNGDVNTFADQFKGGEQPTAAAKKKFGSTLRKSAEAPEAGYGPGVNDSNASALPE